MRSVCSFTSTAVLALALVACGSGDPTSVGPDAPIADQLDVCALVPKATAALVLGLAAHDPENTSGRADSGNCLWHGAAAGQVAVFSVSGSGVNADVFAQLCGADSPPLPMLGDLGVGVATCGRFDPAGGGNLWIQLDATRTIIGVSTSIGTQDQALAGLRDLAAHLAR
jgi:hypothetical protein